MPGRMIVDPASTPRRTGNRVGVSIHAFRAPQLLAASVGALLVLLTVVPLALLLVGSFRPDGLPLTSGWTFAHYIDVWGSAYDWWLVTDSRDFRRW